MESRSVCMRAIFSGLSEKNRGIGRLVAKSMKVAQEPAQPPAKPSKSARRQRQGRLYVLSEFLCA